MNAHEMVIGIVLIVTIGSIIRAKLGVGRRFRGERFAGLHGSQDNAEADRLRDEVRQLKERVAVLERLATDSSTALDREFDKLRQIDRA
ncbi:hypothetical protein FHS91_001228 [Sphingobium xanthum]|jgi:hypothetical protein|uniref:hypothetical protein n=1 Tax=Sphingobium xanthum TaxID=1387165 RepID=UPI001C8C5E0D|nr:hypothetical protein [Sphingobium xanthum]